MYFQEEVRDRRTFHSRFFDCMHVVVVVVVVVVV